MNTYWVVYPRGFANEYTVYVVRADLVSQFVEVVPGAERINRTEAVWLGTSRPREAKRDGEQWYGGLFVGAAGMSRQTSTIADRLEACAEDTSYEIDTRVEYRRLTAV